MSLQYPCDAFDLAVREKVHARKGESTEKLLKLITKYEKSDDIAFQAVTIDREPIKKLGANTEDSLEFLLKLGVGDNKANHSSQFNHLFSRKGIADEIRKKCPESFSKVISSVLYASYWQDMFDGMSSAGPRAGNTSEKPKTVGQIAQQLLDSWKTATVWAGMEIAVESKDWSRLIDGLSDASYAKLLRDLAGRMNLAKYKRSRRGPKPKSPPKRDSSDGPHVSTARILAERNSKKPKFAKQ